MNQRIFPIVLGVLLALLQAHLWLGRGSIPDVHQMQQQLTQIQTQNAQAQLRNDQLTSEVSDLQQGHTVVEELARQEMGMIKPDEMFIQYARRN